MLQLSAGVHACTHVHVYVDMLICMHGIYAYTAGPEKPVTHF